MCGGLGALFIIFLEGFHFSKLKTISLERDNLP